MGTWWLLWPRSKLLDGVADLFWTRCDAKLTRWNFCGVLATDLAIDPQILGARVSDQNQCQARAIHRRPGLADGSWRARWITSQNEKIPRIWPLKVNKSNLNPNFQGHIWYDFALSSMKSLGTVVYRPRDLTGVELFDNKFFGLSNMEVSDRMIFSVSVGSLSSHWKPWGTCGLPWSVCLEDFHIFFVLPQKKSTFGLQACRFGKMGTVSVPAQASGMDPQQRHVLETSYEALFNAGRSGAAVAFLPWARYYYIDYIP